MKWGDIGYVRNYSDINDEFWEGENFIKVGEDQYWAWPFGVVEMQTIKDQLKGMYTRITGRSRQDDIPGFTGKAVFHRVPTLSMKVFKLRGGKE